MKRLFKNQRGYSLLELLVAVSLLSIGLLATASMQGVAVNSNGIAGRLSAASAIAQQVQEDIMAWSRDDIRLRTSVPDTPYMLDPENGRNDRTVIGAGTFRAAYSITPNFNGTTNLTRIIVTVTRTDAQGATADVTQRGEVRMMTYTSYKRVFTL